MNAYSEQMQDFMRRRVMQLETELQQYDDRPVMRELCRKSIEVYRRLSDQS